MPKSKKDLANEISNKLGISKKSAQELVVNFFQLLINNHKKKINIHNFGTFRSKESPERIGRNPKTMEEFLIKSRKSISFSSSKKLQKKLNK